MNKDNLEQDRQAGAPSLLARGAAGMTAAAKTAAPLTQAMAEFALGTHVFPPLARARALDAVTDCVACMFAGSREPLAGPLRIVLPSAPSPGEALHSVLVGTGRFAAPADAALFNGTLAHALDYDDTNHPGYAHPSSVLVSTLLALAPVAPFTGQDLIGAYIVGFEIFGKLGRAMNTQHYKRGWHATATLGAIASAVVAGRVLRLDRRQMTMALGIAASAASGLRANFGSMVKPLHAGYAARNGVLAALLAREGFDASAESIEHDFGYLHVFNDGIGFDPAPLLALGESLEILTRYGLALKAYPSCGATHTGIEAALALRGDCRDETIESVHAGVSEMAFSPLIHVMPNTPLEGKFSLHYCIAAALVFGEVNLATFTDEKVNDPRVRALIPRISMELEERLRDDGEFPAEVTVRLASGRQLTQFVPLAMGKPERWLSPERLRAKFDDCTAAFDAQSARAIYESLRQLDSAVGVEGLLQGLQAVPRQVSP